MIIEHMSWIVNRWGRLTAVLSPDLLSVERYLQDDAGKPITCQWDTVIHGFHIKLHLEVYWCHILAKKTQLTSFGNESGDNVDMFSWTYLAPSHSHLSDAL
jgi:hypothetical protein